MSKDLIKEMVAAIKQYMPLEKGIAAKMLLPSAQAAEVWGEEIINCGPGHVLFIEYTSPIDGPLLQDELGQFKVSIVDPADYE